METLRRDSLNIITIYVIENSDLSGNADAANRTGGLLAGRRSWRGPAQARCSGIIPPEAAGNAGGWARGRTELTTGDARWKGRNRRQIQI